MNSASIDYIRLLYCNEIKTIKEMANPLTKLLIGQPVTIGPVSNWRFQKVLLRMELGPLFFPQMLSRIEILGMWRPRQTRWNYSRIVFPVSWWKNPPNTIARMKGCIIFNNVLVGGTYQKNIHVIARHKGFLGEWCSAPLPALHNASWCHLSPL